MGLFTLRLDRADYREREEGRVRVREGGREGGRKGEREEGRELWVLRGFFDWY